MSQPGNQSQEYLKNAVMTATPEQLQLMLYDGAIRFALRGGEGIRAGDREASFNALDRAQRIVLELNSGIRADVNPELAEQMAALYSFVYRRLVDANLNQDIQAIDEAVRILRHQRETWVMLMEKIRDGEGAPATPPPAAAPQPAPAPSSPSGFVPDGENSTFSAEG